MRSATVSGTRLRELREEREMTLAQVASLTGSHITMISKIERGERQPSGRLFGRICRALGVEKSVLLVKGDGEVAA